MFSKNFPTEQIILLRYRFLQTKLKINIKNYYNLISKNLYGTNPLLTTKLQKFLIPVCYFKVKIM